MTTAGICTIGDEILIGQITDTNSAKIAVELGKAGIRVTRMVSVGDSRPEIENMLTELLGSSDVVIVTGGLGPTKDDVTKNVIFGLSGSLRYVTDEEQLSIIHRILSSRGLDVLESNRRQASVPENCDVIPNRLGTAPVTVTRFPEGRFGHKATLYSLPGVPYEALGAMPDVIKDICASYMLAPIYHKTIMTYGIAESALAEKISAWEESLPSGFSLAYLPDPVKGVALRMSVYGDKPADDVLEGLLSGLRAILGDAIYSEQEDTLQAVVGKLLSGSGKTVSTAESCTGGKIASLITSVAGASAYYLGSVVSYSESVKESVLGVRHEIISRHGAVSPECVAAMAEGVRRLTGSDFSVATSGYAGPDGNPAGLVWVGLSSASSTKTASFSFRNDRLRNIERFSASALDALRRFILSENA